MKNFKNIKEHFDSKTINPSKESWDKLEMMLQEDTQKPKKKRHFFKYAVAACFALIGFTFWYSSENNLPKTPIQEVVIDKKTNTKLENKTEKLDENLQKNEIVTQEIIKTPEVNTSENLKIKLKNRAIKNGNITIEKQEIVNNSQINNDLKIENPIVENENKAIENIETIATTQKTTVSINSELLLKAAENDLDLEHRDKTLLKLKNSFNEIKTYVNNINYQKN
jgi:hypothetical protein